MSVVGVGINSSYANAVDGTAVLLKEGIIPAGIHTSSFRITWMVPRDRMEHAVRQLHRQFIERCEL